MWRTVTGGWVNPRLNERTQGFETSESYTDGVRVTIEMIRMMMMMTKISSSRKLYSKHWSKLRLRDMIPYTVLRAPDFKFCCENKIRLEQMIKGKSPGAVFIYKVKNIMGYEVAQLTDVLGYVPEGCGFICLSLTDRKTCYTIHF